MAESKSLNWCRRVVHQLGKVGLVFLASLLVFILLVSIGHNSLLLIADTLVLAVSGIWTAFQIIRYISRCSMWSLRNRLLTVYGLFGILPVLLMLTLVGLSAWALTSELAIYLASSELSRRLSSIQTAAEGLRKTPPQNRKDAAAGIFDYFRIRFPSLRLYYQDATGSHHYPENAPALPVPDGWHNATGLLEHDGQFYAWAHMKENGETFIAIAPITEKFIDDLVPNLGQITLSEIPHPQGSEDDLALQRKPASNPDYEFKNGKLINKKTGKPAPHFTVHNATRLPPPMNRLDVDVNWVSSYSHFDWDDPNNKHSAYLSVLSRPSAVYSAIFSGSDILRSALLIAMITVAVLFLLVEIVALVIGVSLSRRITRVVNELYQGTRRVIQGDFSNRIPVRGNDQLCELATSFNQMTGNLERLLSIEKEKERLQSELEIAREVQNALYPKSAPPVCGLRLTVQCEPARVVSGDYYDYENIQSGKLAFSIGDVAGKGISAALLMATMQAAMRAQITSGLASQDQHPVAAARLVSDLNKQIYAHTAPEKYATFFFALYDESTCTLTYTNAGHLPPILIRNGEATMLDVNGTVVGAFPFSKYDESKVCLQPNDLLICYTDGITEPENAYGEMFGEQRLIDLVSRSAHEDDQTIIRKIIEAVRSWHVAEELSDDMTLLIARRLDASA